MNFFAFRKPPQDIWFFPIWVYLLGVSFSVQFFVLPTLFPQWHGGGGLLMGTDSTVFHEIAEGQAQRIAEEGWGVWKLSPRGQITAGIASLFYRLFTPKPWVMIPLYTLLFTLAAYCLWKVYTLLESPPRPILPILAVIPFWGFPSAVLLYAQLLKDVFFIFGNVLFLYAWLNWIKKGREERDLSYKDFFFLFITSAGGYLSAWLFRPYWGPVFLLLAFFYLCLILLRESRRWISTSSFSKVRGGYLALSLLMTAMTAIGTQQKKIPDTLTSQAAEEVEKPVVLTWKKTSWLPPALDRQLEILSRSRLAFIQKYPEAGSTIDKDRVFHEAKDLLLYIPRALYVGFFMPTPLLAAENGGSPAGTVMRRIAGGEMIVLYLSYPLVLFSLWRWRKKTEMWGFLFWVVMGILLYTVTSPNIGALYRFRYGFLTALAGAGIYGGLCRSFAREL